VVCVHTTRHELNGIPTGSVYDMRCRACGRTLVLESPGRSIFSLIAAAPFLFMGSFFVVGVVPWLGELVEGRAEIPSGDGLFLALLFAAFLYTGAHLVTKTALRIARARASPLATPRSTDWD
jgi:hypothetical protein